MHTFDSKFRYMITIIIVAQNDPIHQQDALCSHQGGHVLNLQYPRHHGSGRQLQQPLTFLQYCIESLTVR